MTTSNELTRRELVEDLAEIPDEQTVRKAFGRGQNAPELTILQSGSISPDVTYELASGKIPHTREDYFAVNVSSLQPGSPIDNWLVSGVFWTYHEAQSYIHYLQSSEARIF
jgi:hypothetical protein